MDRVGQDLGVVAAQWRCLLARRRNQRPVAFLSTLQSRRRRTCDRCCAMGGGADVVEAVCAEADVGAPQRHFWDRSGFGMSRSKEEVIW